MYAAINQFGELIYAKEAKKDQIYVCPYCLTKVVLINKEKGRSYFRHLKACSLDIKNEGTYLKFGLKETHRGESKEHKQAKNLLRDNFRNFGYECAQEVIFEKINQIADLMVEDSSCAWIVEYQKSVISSIDMDKRQKNYQALGFQVQWLIDDYYFKQRGLSTWVRRCIAYSKKLGYHVWTLDLNQYELKCYHHIPLVYSLNNLDIKLTSYSYKENWLLALNGSLKAKSDVKNIYLKRSESRSISLIDYSFIIQSIKSNLSYRVFLNQLYNYQINLEEIPRWVFNNWQVQAMKEPGWLIWIWAFESMLWLNRNLKINPEGEGLNFSSFSSRMNEHLDNNHFSMFHFPLMGQSKTILEETLYILYYVLKRLME
ncbi:competence protein CoiA [Facklamia sp. P13055]|uniref:competence protein CoiA n=1 Tax=unclassified Facklamia TaxID=2622293 RepID=UPI003D17FB32